ncbi:hypothetical protein CPLU01_13050 [Colletotrichum plurivorum]|uniref:Uncharacterized protein n=1 Tax=Colletotrichum plurivorum TaxID=2175906 RepID=A0A8H6N3Y3_9PEZI|nr:hypothetical protein CPLU01_13050 [Colletotrichum plurivorum]
MKLASAALIALCGQVAMAGVDLIMCKGKPPSNWGPPNCNDADKATCSDLCTNKWRCTNQIGKDPQSAGYCATAIAFKMNLLGLIWGGNAAGLTLSPAPV